MLRLAEKLLELLVAVLERLNLLAFPLSGGLSSSSVAKDALDAALLLLIFRLSPFPALSLAASSANVIIALHHTWEEGWSWAPAIPDPMISSS